MILTVKINTLRDHFQRLNDELFLLAPYLSGHDKINNKNVGSPEELNKNLAVGMSTEIRENIEKLIENVETLTELSRKFRRLSSASACVSLMDRSSSEGLSNDDILRYSRQIILPNFGVSGQLKLKQSSFLIVGIGGLGCPAAQYLTAAGCGRIGLVDYDLVERSNFHRQTLHAEHYINQPKVFSAKHTLEQINPHCQIDTHQQFLSSENALALMAQYDIVLDCTDNVATRYLLNDACVMLKKPLVSGSALQLDGQLTVYNYGNSPCYRCLFPVPPPPETVGNCGDSGVLGAVTGIIGSLQALEAIKLTIGMGENLSGRMLIFDGTTCIFRNIKLRSKRVECDICSETPLITNLINYEQFCGMEASDKNHSLALLGTGQRISVNEYNENWRQRPHVLVDVRTAAEFEICKLPQAVNLPLKQILNDNFVDNFNKQFNNERHRLLPFIVYCRRGNDSQIAVKHMHENFPDLTHCIKDIAGGLHAWHYNIDKNFPIY